MTRYKVLDVKEDNNKSFILIVENENGRERMVCYNYKNADTEAIIKTLVANDIVEIEITTNESFPVYEIKRITKENQMITVELTDKEVKAIAVALERHWHRMTDDNGNSLTGNQEFSDCVFETSKRFDKILHSFNNI